MDEETQNGIDVRQARLDKNLKKLEKKVEFLKTSFDTLGSLGQNTASGKSLRKQLNNAKKNLFKSRKLFQANESSDSTFASNIGGPMDLETIQEESVDSEAVLEDPARVNDEENTEEGDSFSSISVSGS